MALQLTLTNKLMKRTDSNAIATNTALDVELTLSAGWSDVDSIKAIVNNNGVETEIVVENGEFTIPAANVETFGFSLKLVGFDDGGDKVIETYPCKFAASIGEGGSGITLPELPADADEKDYVLAAKNGVIGWYELTSLE